MTVSNIMNALQQSLGKGAGNLTIDGDIAFHKPLNLGQIIKGKVMMHYEGGRYLVDFAGQEKVVDSTVPLKTGELIQGRVIGLDDKVHLQRMWTDQHAARSIIPGDLTLGINLQSLTSNEKMVVELFGQYQGKLTRPDLGVITNLLKGAKNPIQMARSGLVLQKIGLPVAPELVRAIYRSLDTTVAQRNIADRIQLELIVDSNGTKGQQDAAIQQLGILLKSFNVYDDQQSIFSGTKGLTKSFSKGDVSLGSGADDRNYTDDRDSTEWLLGYWLLNVQSGGSVSHKYASVPMRVGDHEVDIQLAMFSQKDKSLKKDGAKHSHLVFSLDTDYLGKVEISIKVVDKNLRIEVTTQSEYSADILAKRMNDLRKSLSSFDWNARDIKYGLNNDVHAKGVVRYVAEHYITQDSLNQLM